MAMLQTNRQAYQSSDLSAPGSLRMAERASSTSSWLTHSSEWSGDAKSHFSMTNRIDAAWRESPQRWTRAGLPEATTTILATLWDTGENLCATAA